MSHAQKIENLLFIGGHRKSGTTMVRDLFDNHPDVSIYPPDLTVLYAYYPDFIKNNNDPLVLKQRLQSIIIQELEQAYKNNNAELPAPIEVFEDHFFEKLQTEAQITNPHIIIEQLITAYNLWSRGTSNSGNLSILKETSVEIYTNQIFEWFPNGKILQIMRDPRDNFAALKAGVDKKYKKYGEDNNITLFSLLNRLGTSMKMGLINKKTYGEERYKIVKFEDIAENPEKYMKTLSDWLGIPYQISLTTPTKFGQSTKGNNFEGRDFIGISKEHINAWKKRIETEEAQIIEFHLGHLMKEFGYKLEFDISETAKAASNFYKWNNYKYFYFDRFKEEQKLS